MPSTRIYTLSVHDALPILKKGSRAEIADVGGEGYSSELIRRLMEMGFLKGSTLEVLHEAPFSGDPIAVRVRGSIIALRRNEAKDRKSTRLNSSHTVISYAVYPNLHSFRTRRSSDLEERQSS